MPQRTWPQGPAWSSDGGETARARPSGPAAPLGSDGWPAGPDPELAAPEPDQEPRREPDTEPRRPRFSARGAALAMLALFLGGNLLASWLSLSALAGLSFVAGCALAASYTQRRRLLFMVTTPPVIFLIAVIGAESLTSPGSTLATSAEAVAAGTILTLAAAAPWLLGGVLLCVLIAMFRGLPQCVRDLGRDLRGQGAEADRPG